VGLGKMVACKMGGRGAVAVDVVGWLETAVGFERVGDRSLAVFGQTQLISTMANKVISKGMMEYQKCLPGHRFCGALSWVTRD
jgi:hypothetical protein